MKNSVNITNITITTFGKTMRLVKEDAPLMQMIICNAPISTKITGKRNGKEVTYVMTSAGRFQWIESK